MKCRTLAATVFWLMFSAAISFAEDRGVATAIAWSPDGGTIAVASTSGLWLFDTDFNEIGYVATPELDAYPPSTMDWPRKRQVDRRQQSQLRRAVRP